MKEKPTFVVADLNASSMLSNKDTSQRILRPIDFNMDREFKDAATNYTVKLS